MAWELVKEVRYPAWSTYSGEYGGVIVQFQTGPEQLPLMNQLGEWLADRIPQEAAKEGVTPLFLRVYRDVEPTWVTWWNVELHAKSNPFALVVLLPLLPLIIKGVLILAGLIASFFIVKEFSGLWQATPQELEREAEREAFTERLIVDYGLEPKEAMEVSQGLIAPPVGVEIPDILKPTIAGIGIGTLLLIGLLLFMVIRK